MDYHVLLTSHHENPDAAQIPCDLIVDPQPLSGRRNMALDAALLATGQGSQRSIVRIYRWREPTVSLGHFQQAGPQDERLQGLPVVRRLTGGGAILHDREITYSCVVPDTHPIRHSPSRLYGLVHEAIIELLAGLKVEARLRGSGLPPQGLPAPTTASAIGQTSEPFLCFLRADPNDIVMDVGACDGSGRRIVHKVTGSAQRRRRGTILQHGSILLSASPLTPSVPGISDLSPGFLQEAFAEELPYRISRILCSSCRRRDYLPAERDFAAREEGEGSAAESVNFGEQSVHGYGTDH
jgi:lipoate-protein ligase A